MGKIKPISTQSFFPSTIYNRTSENKSVIFNIHGSVHRNNIVLYKSQQDAHVTEFILSDNCSTYFWRCFHPSSGAQATVTTASGNRYTVTDKVKFTDKE